MRWPRGQMRYNLATLAELRVFQPLPYTLELDGEVRQVEAMLVAVGNGPSFGGGLRITHGASLDDGLLDVVIIKTMSKPDLLRTYPKLFTGGHTRHRQYERHLRPHRHRRRARHRGVRRRGADRGAAADRRGGAAGAEGAGALMSVALRELRPLPPRAGRAGLRGLRADVRLHPRRLPGPGLQGARGGPRGAGRGAHRLRQDAGRRVRRPPGPVPGPQVLLHHPDQGAVQPEVRRPGASLRRGPGRPAHRRQHDQRRGADRGDDHRGAPQHALRGLLDAGRARLRGDGRGALPRRPVPRRGVGGGDHPPARVGGAGVPVRDRVERRGVRRVAGHGPRRDLHDRRGAAARAALPARDGRAADLRPVQGRGRVGQPRPDADRPRRLALGPHPRPPQQARHAPQPRRRPRPGHPPRRSCPAATTSSSGSTRRACCRRSTSCSAGSAATRR